MAATWPAALAGETDAVEAVLGRAEPREEGFSRWVASFFGPGLWSRFIFYTFLLIIVRV